MGFGVLFCGYFLLLNFINCAFTDIICALIMLYALYKLSSVNGTFKYAAVGALVFSVLGLFEIGYALLEMTALIKSVAEINLALATARHLIVAVTTALMLMGMRDIASEVGLPALKTKCNYLSFVTVGVYSVNIILEASGLASFISGQILAICYVVSIVATVALIITNLTAIFGCYYSICMPEDNTAEFTEKKSRFGFVNAFRAHEDEKRKEYAEYKLDKFKKRVEKAKSKTKDKK